MNDLSGFESKVWTMAWSCLVFSGAVLILLVLGGPESVSSRAWLKDDDVLTAFGMAEGIEELLTFVLHVT